jgi:hypothetical protein
MGESVARQGGCLTEAQLAEVRAAEPGKAPEALARHLASCERCQERALFGAARPPGKKKATPEFPSVRRAIFYAALVLGAILVFVWSLVKLAGRLR